MGGATVGGERRLAAQAQGGTRTRAEEGGGWARACGSARAGPEQLPPPFFPSPPPLSPFLSLREASSTLAARALMSGTSAGADWPDARVRESGSRVWLSSYSGNGASNPREGSPGSRLPPADRRALLCSSAARRLPSVFPGLCGSWGARRPALDLPRGRPAPHSPHPLPPPVPGSQPPAAADRKRICVA